MRPLDPFASAPSPENLEKNDVARPRMGSILSGHPDRRRIDSDVRAFLRQPSTPWITFDKEGRPSQLGPGEMLPARSSVHPEVGFFPVEPIAGPIDMSQARVEPSSLAVAADLSDAPATMDHDADPDTFAATGGGSRKRVVGVALMVVALLATVCVGLAMPSARATTETTTTKSAANALAAAAMPVEAPPPDLAMTGAAAPAADPKPAAPAADDPSKAAVKKYGRLTIDGQASHVNVFMDGKRLLGRGTRSFTVLCGAHTIAVGDKNDGKDVDVPCSGELTIAR